MRIIDDIRRDPTLVAYIDAKRHIFATGSDMFDAVSFDNTAIASAMYIPGTDFRMSPLALEWTKADTITDDLPEHLQPQPHHWEESRVYQPHLRDYILTPPFDKCLFEFRCFGRPKKDPINVGVYVVKMPKEKTAQWFTPEENRAMAFGLAMDTVAIYEDGRRILFVGDVFGCDEDGRLVSMRLRVDPFHVEMAIGILSFPNLVTLTSLMMLNLRAVKSRTVQAPGKSRQQRRWESTHAHRVTDLGPVTYHVLDINTGYTDHEGNRLGNGGLGKCFHMVRGHARHLRSGRIVRVKPHTRGDATKGIRIKDYREFPSKTSG